MGSRASFSSATLRFVPLALVVSACTGGCPSATTVKEGLTVDALTGFWQGDDQALYVARGVVTPDGGYLTWAGLDSDGGLNLGISRSSVFVGTPGVNDAGQVTVEGSYLDVPRGLTFGSGTLALQVSADLQTLQATSVTGPMTARRWTKIPPPPLPDPIAVVMNRVHKNVVDYSYRHTEADYNEVLGPYDNLIPARDASVVWGLVSGTAAGVDFGWTWATDYPTFCSYPNGKEDGDMTLEVQVAPTSLDLGNFWSPQYWDASCLGFGGLTLTDCAGSPVGGGASLDVAVGHANQRYSTNHTFHSEIIMYGRDGDCSDSASVRAGGGRVELPGWADSGSNAVLINGRPSTGHVSFGSSAGVQLAAWSLGAGPDVSVRVSGLVSLDCGHYENGQWGVCGSGIGGEGLEIHPVYAVDVIQPPTPDLNGVWGDIDGRTYYLRFTGTQVAILGLGPFRDRTFAMAGLGQVVDGRMTVTWADLPWGTGTGGAASGTLVGAPDGSTLTFGGSLGTRVLSKLYGACEVDVAATCAAHQVTCGPTVSSCGTAVDCGPCPIPPPRSVICTPAPGPACPPGTVRSVCNDQPLCCKNGLPLCRRESD